MTTSTRDSHEIIIQPELNRCEKNIGERVTTSYAGEGRGMMTENKDKLWKAFIEEETKKLNLKYYQEQNVTMSIFQLPAYATSITPRSVSFGPFHHGEQNLKFAEYWKQMAVLKFISRTNLSLEHLMGEMRDAMEELQAQYALLEDKWRNDTEFVKLMIWDGCFMLELLRADPSTSFIYDPQFGGHGGQGRLPRTMWDVLLLDNQLPLLVVKVLLRIEADSFERQPMIDQEINNLVFKFLGMEDMHDNIPTLGLHILDLCRKGMIGPLTCSPCNNDELRPQKARLPTYIMSMGWFFKTSTVFYKACSGLFKTIKGMIQAMPSLGKAQESHVSASSPLVESRQNFSAVKLHESGVAFMKSKNNTIRDISFDKDNGILMLPPLNIDEATEPSFLSLMLFEQLHLMPQGYLLRQLHKVDQLSNQFLEQLAQIVTSQLDEPFQSKLNIPDEIQSQIERELNHNLSVVDFAKNFLREIITDILHGRDEAIPSTKMDKEKYNFVKDLNGLYDLLHDVVCHHINPLPREKDKQVLDQAFKKAYQQAMKPFADRWKLSFGEEFRKQIDKLSKRQTKGFGQEVMSYIFFMRDLIDSDRDVDFLKSKEIIFLDDVSEQAAAQLLKRLTEKTPNNYISTSAIAVIRRDVNEYSKKNVTRLSFQLNKVSISLKRRMYRWSEILMNLYFNNPWSTMGVIGGVILLVLTCVQTYYAFLSYHHPKGKG